VFYGPRQTGPPREQVNESKRTGKVATSAFFSTCKGSMFDGDRHEHAWFDVALFVTCYALLAFCQARSMKGQYEPKGDQPASNNPRS